jgi:hypothetical protein
VLSGDATNTNSIVFGLIQPGLELTIYRIRCDHANHYTTDAVLIMSWTQEYAEAIMFFNQQYVGYLFRCYTRSPLAQQVTEKPHPIMLNRVHLA